MRDAIILLLVAVLQASFGSVCGVRKCPYSDGNYLIKQPCNAHLFPPLRYCGSDAVHLRGDSAIEAVRYVAVEPEHRCLTPQCSPHCNQQIVARTVPPTIVQTILPQGCKNVVEIKSASIDGGLPAFCDPNIQSNPNCGNLCLKHVLVKKVCPVYDECIQTVPVVKNIVRHEPITTVDNVPVIERRISYCPEPECCDKRCEPEYISVPCSPYDFEKEYDPIGSCEPRYAPLPPPNEPKSEYCPPDVYEPMPKPPSYEPRPTYPPGDIRGPRQPLPPCEVRPRCPCTDPCEPRSPPPPYDPMPPRYPPRDPCEPRCSPPPYDPMPPRYPPRDPCEPRCSPPPYDPMPPRYPPRDPCEPRSSPPLYDPMPSRYPPRDPCEPRCSPPPYDPMPPRYPPRDPCEPKCSPPPYDPMPPRYPSRDPIESRCPPPPCEPMPPRYTPREPSKPKYPPLECESMSRYPPRDTCEPRYPPPPCEPMSRYPPRDQCEPKYSPPPCRRKPRYPPRDPCRPRYPPPPPPSPCPYEDNEDKPSSPVYKPRRPKPYRPRRLPPRRRKPKYSLPESRPRPDCIKDYDAPKYVINRYPPRCPPRIRDKVIHIPIRRRGYRSVVEQKVVRMPVKRKIKKNLVETTIKKMYAPCDCC